jgi:hypothetical protein
MQQAILALRQKETQSVQRCLDLQVSEIEVASKRHSEELQQAHQQIRLATDQRLKQKHRHKETKMMERFQQRKAILHRKVIDTTHQHCFIENAIFLIGWVCVIVFSYIMQIASETETMSQQMRADNEESSRKMQFAAADEIQRARASAQQHVELAAETERK